MSKMCRAVGILWLSLALTAGAVPAKDIRIGILHTNDLHQSLDNLARIAHYVKEYKTRNPNSVFVDAGDYFDRGSSLVPLTRGEAIYATMARMGYDAWVVGNHDWSYGARRLAELMRLHPARVLGTNLEFYSGPVPDNVVKTWVSEFQGVRLGMLGLGFRHSRSQSVMYLTDPIEAARLAVRELKKKGADIIVAVTHLGDKKMWHEKPGVHIYDTDLAKAFPEIDVIVGGHTHQRITGAAARKYHDETGAIIVQAGDSGRCVGVLTLLVDDKKKTINRWEANLVTVEKTFPEDPAVASLLAAFYDRFMPDAKQVVAQFEQLTEFHNFAYWFAGLLRAATGADIAIVPRKALYDEPGEFEQGKRTAEQFRALIRDRCVVRSQVSGRELIRYLTSAEVRDHLNPFHHGQGNFSGDAYYYSGMEATYDVRDGSVSVDLVPERTYTLVTVWPFEQKDAGKYKHRKPPRADAEKGKDLPGLALGDRAILEETTWQVVDRAARDKTLTITRKFREPLPEWRVWTQRFEAKLSRQ